MGSKVDRRDGDRSSVVAKRARSKPGTQPRRTRLRSFISHRLVYWASRLSSAVDLALGGRYPRMRALGAVARRAQSPVPALGSQGIVGRARPQVGAQNRGLRPKPRMLTQVGAQNSSARPKPRMRTAIRHPPSAVRGQALRAVLPAGKGRRTRFARGPRFLP